MTATHYTFPGRNALRNEANEHRPLGLHLAPKNKLGQKRLKKNCCGFFFLFLKDYIEFSSLADGAEPRKKGPPSVFHKHLQPWQKISHCFC